jgi:hypothetical protein
LFSLFFVHLFQGDVFFFAPYFFLLCNHRNNNDKAFYPVFIKPSKMSRHLMWNVGN